MLRAQLKNGSFITLALLTKEEIGAIRLAEKFFCPACKEEVIVKAGERVTPHFAHQVQADCNHYHGGEGTYHAKGKLLLYHWLKQQRINVELEVFIPEIKQRPDMLIHLGKRKIAVEYQCAKVSAKEIRLRNQGYQKLDIIPIWILGAKQFKRITDNRFSFNAFSLQFIHQFSPDFPTSIYYFCPHTLQLSIINDIYLTSMKHAVGQLTFQKLSQMNFLDLFMYQRFTEEQLYSLWFFQQRSFRLRERRRAFGSELAYRNWLYERGIYPHALPSIVNLPVQSQFRMKVPLYNWQSRLVIDCLRHLRVGDTIEFTQIEKGLRGFIQPAEQFPLLKKTSHPIIQYLLILVRLNILEQVSERCFRKCQPIVFYQSIEDAVRGDASCVARLQEKTFR